MMKRGLLVAWFWFFGISVFAQEDPVLMRVNGKDILRSEFEYSYRHRTGNADAKLSPKEYAELFAQSPPQTSPRELPFSPFFGKNHVTLRHVTDKKNSIDLSKEG